MVSVTCRTLRGIQLLRAQVPLAREIGKDGSFQDAEATLCDPVQHGRDRGATLALLAVLEWALAIADNPDRMIHQPIQLDNIGCPEAWP